MRRVGLWIIAGFALLSMLPGSVSANSITLNFPSAASTLYSNYGSSGSNTVPLGVGGGGVNYIAGSSLTETFTGTGLASAVNSHWLFSMSDFTDTTSNPWNGVSTFDVLINGQGVGSYQFTAGQSGYGGTIPFDLTFGFAPISGPDFTLEFITTSTVPDGDGSWNWFPGGTVTLTDGGGSPVPEPSTLLLLSSGFVGLAGLGWRRNR